MFTKSQRIVLVFGAYALIALAVLAVFHALSFELYFVLCLLGFLAIVEVSGPYILRPRWRARANLILLAAVLVFVFLVIVKVFSILRIKPF